MSSRAERRREKRAREKRAKERRANNGTAGKARKPDPAKGAAGGSGPGRAAGLPEPVPVARVALLAVALALVAGLVEVAVVLYLKRLGLIVRTSEHFPWMTPTAHLLAFLLVAALLLVLRRAWPRLAGRAATAGVLMGLFALAVVGVIEALYPAAVVLLAVGVGVQAGRMARGRFGDVILRAAPPVAAALGAALLGVAIYSFTAPGRAETRALADLPAASSAEGRPNILLVVMDAVRAQSMGLHNPSLRNTPVLNALAGQSVVFDRAYAPSPWTLPTHATLFTGRWPTEHEADWKRVLDGRFPTLGERLTAAGYATGGFSANLAFTGAEQGLDRGFGRYEVYPVNLGQIVLSSALGRKLASIDRLRNGLGLELPINEVPAEEVTDRFLRWRDRHPDRPFFAFMNYYDAHEPFPPAPGGPPITPLTHRHTLLSGTVTHFEAPPPNAQDRFLRGYLAGYRAAIAYIDRELQRLIRELESRGELANTIVVVTSDHGEVIGEHGLVGHNSSLYHPNLWVPLLIRYPAALPAGVRIDNEVTIRHLPATLLDLAGFEAGDLPGRSLARLWADTAGDRAWTDTLYAHLTGGAGFPPWAPAALGPEMHSVVRDARHYILNGDGSEELYHLGRDPGEMRDLAGDPEATPLLRELRSLIRSVPGAAPLPGEPEGPHRPTP